MPADAVFTDTNTWRPVQNNLTSTSTSDCLSAYQGNVLFSKLKTVDLLLQNAVPAANNAYKSFNLISGRKITDYLITIIVYHFYGNTADAIAEPSALFIVQNGSGKRVLLGNNAASVYCTSSTNVAISLTSITNYSISIYGAIKIV